jgi:hypothetical protein
VKYAAPRPGHEILKTAAESLYSSDSAFIAWLGQESHQHKRLPKIECTSHRNLAEDTLAPALLDAMARSFLWP